MEGQAPSFRQFSNTLCKKLLVEYGCAGTTTTTSRGTFIYQDGIDIGCQCMAVKIRNVCCIGAGYVGGPTCAVLAAKNPHVQVSVIDRDTTIIDAWNSERLPIYEPQLYDLVKGARDGLNGGPPNLIFSTDVTAAIQAADLIFVAVNTPTKAVGVGAGEAFDLAHVEAVARHIAESADSDKIIVEKSTVPCGTAKSLRKIFQQLGRSNVRFEVLSNPEFLAEGTAVDDLLDPSRVLLGSEQTGTGLAAAKALKDLYTAWVPPERIINVSVATSEMAKLAANCMLAQRISSINSLSAICESTGADVSELAHAIGLDERIGSKFLKASVGFGGSCFKKDVLGLVYMAETLNLSEVAAYWRAVVGINEYQRARFTKRILSALHNTLANKDMAIFGCAYKANTDDTRESSALPVIAQLMTEKARVRLYDPKVDGRAFRNAMYRQCGRELTDEYLTICHDPYAACADAAAIVILTDWDEFRVYPSPSNDSKVCSPVMSGEEIPQKRKYTAVVEDGQKQHLPPKPGRRLDWASISTLVRRPKMVFDGCSAVEPGALERFGFNVYNIGRMSNLN